MVQPTDTNDSDNCATAASTSDLVKAFNKQHQFPAVTQIWAPDHIVAQLTGRFNDFKRFADLPRALRAAPDATTWAGVQRWLWWLPPSSFARGDGSGGDDARVVCQPRCTHASPPSGPPCFRRTNRAKCWTCCQTWSQSCGSLSLRSSSTLTPLPTARWYGGCDRGLCAL